MHADEKTISSEPSTGSPTVLSLKESGKTAREWTLTLHPTHLALADAPGAQPYVILRDEMMKSAMLLEGVRVFAITKPCKVTFQLSKEATATLAEWIGKPSLATFYMKRRYAWVLPVAIIWMLGSLPLPGSSSNGIEPVRFDLFGFVLGLALVISWAFAKWRPHPVLFLVDSIWFLMMGVYLVRDVLNGRSKLWLVLVVLLFWMVTTGVKHFIRFRRTTIAPNC